MGYGLSETDEKNPDLPHFSCVNPPIEPNMSLRTITFEQTIPSGPFYRLGMKRYLMRPIFLVLFLFVIGFTSLTLFGESRTTDYSFLVPFSVIIIFMPLMHFWGLTYLLKNNVALRGRHLVKVDEEGLNLSGQGFQFFMAWEVFTKVKVYKDWILVYAASNSAMYLYLPEIEDEGDREILKALVNQEVS